MGVATAKAGLSARLTRLMGVSVVAVSCALSLVPDGVRAQDGDLDAVDLPDNAQMLLTADTLVYDNDRETVTAGGGVQIEYAGNRLVADRVIYDRKTQRLTARGRVQIVERDGNRIYADEIDITDDFRDGFVNALRVETVDETYFAAESAERENGELTTFNKGVYTACEPCEEKPGKPPIWQIKSQKIIWNGETRVVRFEKARFEFFGMPIAYLPYFEMADPTVRRKSGFLFPSAGYDGELGVSATVPYFFALSPSTDLTVSGTYYSKQGFLGEAEWRQRLNNGFYNVRIAGISQRDPAAFDGGGNSVNRAETGRAMIGSKGEFDINPRWTFGWDVLAQTDKNFSRTYSISGFADSVHTSQAYLTGLDGRNFFDARAYKFDVQEDRIEGRDEQQPVVAPVVDYSVTPDRPVAGGELNVNVNAQNLYRDEISLEDNLPSGGHRMSGPEGATGRMTAEGEWKRSFVSQGGVVVTPILQARGDAIYTDYDVETVNGVTSFNVPDSAIGSDIRSTYYRYMATAGLEARWPILFSTASATHVLEPVGQLFVRPDAPYQSTLGIPNEDAQSLVFDATSLFERDKFSGYDRIEGGTRANIGLRYSGSFANGWSAHGLFGQSYHLAGDNPYAQPDLVNAGAYSGLETDVSDYVGLVGLASPNGFAVSAGARLDEKTLDLRRTDVKAAVPLGGFGVVDSVAASLQYAFIQAQPLYGFPEDRHEITGRTRVRFDQNWSGFASGTYDLENEGVVNSSFGLSYGDECFIYSMTYSHKRNLNTDETKQTFGFNISLRTLGDIGTSTGALGFSAN